MPSYTVMHAKTPRLLRTSTGADGKPRTEAVTSLDDEKTADTVADQLNTIASTLPAHLHALAQAADARPVTARRSALTAFDTGTGNDPIDTLAATLGRTVSAEPEPVRRAVRDQLAALLDGADDILVTAEAHSDDHAITAVFVANAYLTQASDDTLRGLDEAALADSYETDAVAEFFADTATGTLFDYLSSNPRTFGEPVGFTCRLDSAGFYAWLRAHRPALAAELDT